MRSLVLVKAEDRDMPEEYKSVQGMTRAILGDLEKRGGTTMETLVKKFRVQGSHILVAVGVLWKSGIVELYYGRERIEPEFCK